jgi:hypothetical protein
MEFDQKHSHFDHSLSHNTSYTYRGPCGEGMKSIERSMAKNEAMAALVSTKSARERLEKLTGDFDGMDGSIDDDEAAEVAEGRVLMVDGGWCLAFVLWRCYGDGKGR